MKCPECGGTGVKYLWDGEDMTHHLLPSMDRAWVFSLCNAFLCVQGLVLCIRSQKPFGVGLTNALVVPLGS